MELQVGKKLLAKAPPVHPNSDPPPIKATIKGYGVAAYRRASTNQEAAATSSAKISICKTVKLSGQQPAWPGQQRHQHNTHTPVSYSRAMHHIRLLLLGPRMEITGKNPMKVVTLSNCSHNWLIYFISLKQSIVVTSILNITETFLSVVSLPVSSFTGTFGFW